MAEIKATSRVCGLIGNPVAHSLSPIIHNTLAELLKTELCYVTFPVEEGRLSDAVRGAYALGILGLNVTVPYKTAVMRELSSLDETAAKIGAVNTLVREKDGYRGYNTDMPGLYRALCADPKPYGG